MLFTLPGIFLLTFLGQEKFVGYSLLWFHAEIDEWHMDSWVIHQPLTIPRYSWGIYAQWIWQTNKIFIFGPNSKYGALTQQLCPGSFPSVSSVWFFLHPLRGTVQGRGEGAPPRQWEAAQAPVLP